MTDAELPEQRNVGSFNIISQVVVEPEILLRFSSLHRLLRVTAWCFHWRHKTTPSRTHHSTDTAPTLEPHEIDAALIRWIRTAQALHYRTEISSLSKDRAVPPRSPLIGLCPFMDDSGVMRLGGRLKHAILSQDERHPMIVPPEFWMAHLLVDSCHRWTLHGGVQLTLGLLCHRFWIPRGRAIVKRSIHRSRAQWRAATPQPLMGNLPQERVTPARPF